MTCTHPASNRGDARGCDDDHCPRHGGEPSYARDEHAWHACSTPPISPDTAATWDCPICRQRWVWRRPPRPAARWVRRDRDEEPR